jgi:hypothetical protein
MALGATMRFPTDIDSDVAGAEQDDNISKRSGVCP